MSLCYGSTWERRWITGSVSCSRSLEGCTVRWYSLFLLYGLVTCSRLRSKDWKLWACFVCLGRHCCAVWGILKSLMSQCEGLNVLLSLFSLRAQCSPSLLVLILHAQRLDGSIKCRYIYFITYQPTVKTPDNISSHILMLGPDYSLFMIYSKLHYLSAGFNYTLPWGWENDSRSVQKTVQESGEEEESWSFVCAHIHCSGTSFFSNFQTSTLTT